MERTPEIISRDEAKARGLKRFFTGRPCSKGHLSERTLGGNCLACKRVGKVLLSEENAWKGRFTCAEEVNKYLGGETVSCLLCGKVGFGGLSRHISDKHGTNADAYRARFGISAGRPLATASARDKLKIASARADHTRQFARRKAIAHATIARIDWDRVLERLAAGEFAKDICSGVDGMPKPHHWTKKKQADAAFAARIEELAVRPRDTGKRLSEQTTARYASERAALHWDRFVERIRAGEKLTAVCAEGPPMPSLDILTFRRNSDPAFHELMHEALEGRVGVALRPVTIDRVVAELARGGSYRSAAEAAGIRVASAKGLRRSHPGLIAPLVQANMAARFSAWANARAAAKAARAARQPAFADRETFVRALRSDEVYGAVYIATARLPREIRDDVISDLVVALLDGEITIADLPREVGRFRTAHNRMFNGYAPSLDAQIGGDGFTLGNSLVAAYI